jgi:hypothetical protein
VRSFSRIAFAAIVILASAAATHPNTPAALAAPHFQSIAASPPDSLTLLLFAGFDLHGVTATSRSGWIINGSAHRERTVCEIAMSDGGITLDGAAMERCTLRALRGVAKLSIPSRTREVRGIVSCAREGDEIRITARIATRDYLASTLSTEASSSDPMEYLTALSVLQRNYLADHIGRHAPVADLCDNTHCQRAGTVASSRVYAAVDRASRITLDAGGGHPCYYSVNCGGSTLTPAQIWRRVEPGYSNVRCTYCSNSPRFRWVRTTPATPRTDELMRRAPVAPFVDDDFKIRLGRAIGFNKVLSNTIDRIERRHGVYVIAGRGFGHRVGMCQEGARQLALHGWKADAILRFYFPAARVALRR